MKNGVFKKAFKDTAPVWIGYTVLGVGFGLLLESRGFGVLWAAAMSLGIFSGTLQFVGVELLSSASGLLTAALTSLAVNARYMFYGTSMLEEYQKVRRGRFFLIFALTDETYALVATTKLPAEERPGYYFYVTLLNYLYWLLGSVLGSLLGAALPFSFEGLEFSLTALFITVMLEQWLSSRDHRPILIGACAALFCRLLFGPEHFLIPTMLLMVALLALLRRREEAKG